MTTAAAAAFVLAGCGGGSQDGSDETPTAVQTEAKAEEEAEVADGQRVTREVTLDMYAHGMPGMQAEAAATFAALVAGEMR